jgi:hypothetical protein
VREPLDSHRSHQANAPTIVYGIGFLPRSPVSSCRQLNAKRGGLIRSLRSGRITGLPRYYGPVRPSAPHRYSRLVVSATCASPLPSGRLVPAVPHRSLDQLHASYTPTAACPVIRCPADLSQGIETPLVSTANLWLTTRHRRFTFVRLSDPYLPGVWPRRFDPNAHHRRLLTAAAWGGLKPAPESRLRGACPHLPCSFHTVRRFFPNLLSVCLRHTASRPEEFHPRPLTERCVNLSTHTAPIKQTPLPFSFANARRGEAVSRKVPQETCSPVSCGPSAACTSSSPRPPASY